MVETNTRGFLNILQDFLTWLAKEHGIKLLAEEHNQRDGDYQTVVGGQKLWEYFKEYENHLQEKVNIFDELEGM